MSGNSRKYDDIEGFSSFMGKKLGNERRDTWGMFDKFFDEDFFHRASDPFGEMDRFRRRVENMMEKESKGLFQRSWDSWFSNRFLGTEGDMNIDTTENDDNYTVKIHIPNLKENKIDIRVDENGISIDGQYSQEVEKKDPKGNVVSKQELRRSVTRRLALPENAEYGKAKIENKKDKIVIVLPKYKG